MARPKKDAAPDLSAAVELTAGAIDRLTCPVGKTQAFMRDTKAPGLRVRVTAAGAKSYVFEAKLNRQTIRRTIGDVRARSIESARKEANRLTVMLDNGTDPREVEREKAADKAAQAAAVTARALTVGEIWPLYLAKGKPKRRDEWKPRYRADLEAMAVPGGVPKKRGAGLTRPGPLYPLLALPLAEVDEDALKAWYDREAVAGPHQATRALMMFRGFLRWCAGQKEYRDLADRDAGKAAAILESLPANVKRKGALQDAQVAGWWAGVVQLPNPTASAYLRALLLTGARREEMAALKWDDIDFRWKKLTMADKVEKTRTIPLSAYLAAMFAATPRSKLKDGSPNPYVFASVSKSGRIVDVRSSHERALSEAGIGHLSFHDLRRSFCLLGEAAEAPEGAIAQISGHTSSATAEGYKPRSVDALRPYAARIEAHILGVAGVQFDAAQAASTMLRMVAVT